MAIYEKLRSTKHDALVIVVLWICKSRPEDRPGSARTAPSRQRRATKHQRTFGATGGRFAPALGSGTALSAFP